VTSLPILTILLLLPTIGVRAEEAEVIPSARLAPSEAKPAQQPPKPAPVLSASNATDSSSAFAPPPDIFRNRSAVSGGAALSQDVSFAPKGTTLNRYQHKLYLAIGSRWNIKVQQTMAKIGVDGTISDLSITQKNTNSILGTISGESIKECSGLIGPFPADLKAENPKGFSWQLAFRIY
jgi:hypothetical protein